MRLMSKNPISSKEFIYDISLQVDGNVLNSLKDIMHTRNCPKDAKANSKQDSDWNQFVPLYIWWEVQG